MDTLQNPSRRALAPALAGAALIALTACTTNPSGFPGTNRMSVKKTHFGNLPDGTAAQLYTLTNASGAQVAITNYGGIVTSVRVPDRDGRLGDVVLGYERLEDYLAGSPYFGCITGRYANRIAGGQFSLDGNGYTLATNNGPNHLHGGEVGFDKKLWAAEDFTTADGVGLELSYLSPDGEEGYPGELSVKVSYTWTNANELQIDYVAMSDQPTVCNLTNHSYFNLAGAGSGDVLEHLVMILAQRYTPVDENLIPTGELAPVAGTPLDFTESRAIGDRIGEDNEQLQRGKGYDHNFVLRDARGPLALAAIVSDPGSGRMLEVFTTEPGIQFYSGNFLDGSNVGKGGVAYQHRYGFCLEAQVFPDSPNQPSFPTAVLRPGEVYNQTTVYQFLAR